MISETNDTCVSTNDRRIEHNQELCSSLRKQMTTGTTGMVCVQPMTLEPNGNKEKEVNETKLTPH